LLRNFQIQKECFHTKNFVVAIFIFQKVLLEVNNGLLGWRSFGPGKSNVKRNKYFSPQ